MKGLESRKTQLAAISAAGTLLALAVYLGPAFGDWTRQPGPTRSVHRVAGSVGVRLLHGLGAVAASLGGPLQRWELRARDFLSRHGRKTPVDERLLFLGIDNESVSLEPLDLDTLFASVPRDSADFRALSLMAGPWPWSREVHGLVLDKLVGAGASVVVFDLLFPKASPNDDAFRDALERHAGRVVVGSNFNPPTLGEGVAGWSHVQPTDTLIPATTPLDARVGYVNFWPDEADGIVRSARLRLTEKGLSGWPTLPDAEVLESLATRAVVRAGAGDRVPAEVDGERTFRYTGEAGSAFSPLPVYQLFVPAYWKQNFGDGARVKGKIVVVGPYGNWQHDEHPTPFGSMPGPEIHLNVMNALLHGAFLSDLPQGVGALLLLLAGAAAWLNAVRTPRPVLEVLRLAGANAILLPGALAAYNFADLFLPVVAPLLALNLSGGACFVFKAVIEGVERRRTRRLLERYVGRDVASELLDQRESVLHSLGGGRKVITILFSDLRGFTTLTESAEDPVALVNQLNEYLDRMVRTVFANGGTLDKFMGDGLMAHWGSIVSRSAETDASNAVRAALQMRVALTELNAEWAARGLLPLELGIGINSGEAIVGNMGSEEKMEVSVIGDPVNLASRIEGATKEYRVELLLGEEAARLVRGAFHLRTIDLIQVKGKTRPVEVFSVIGENDGTLPPVWLDDYEQGVQLYRGREFAGAVDSFASAADTMPDDWLVQEYQRRCAAFIAEPPPAEWTGVFVMTRK